jgi:hypothetical protein
MAGMNTMTMDGPVPQVSNVSFLWVSIFGSTCLTLPPQAELHTFYTSHFGHDASAHFGKSFLRPGHDEPPLHDEREHHVEHAVDHDEHAVDHDEHAVDHDEQEVDHDDYYYYDDDDGLGYYPDGTKRTLTDEQIAIFRHSEIEALRRKQDRQASTSNAEAGSDSAKGQTGGTHYKHKHPEAANSVTMTASTTTSTTTRPGEHAHKPSSSNAETDGGPRKKKTRREPKPDLRKRTWDVVDKGLDSLNYDDM